MPIVDKKMEFEMLYFSYIIKFQGLKYWVWYKPRMVQPLQAVCRWFYRLEFGGIKLEWDPW